jgi:hypothetical protein
MLKLFPHPEDKRAYHRFADGLHRSSDADLVDMLKRLDLLCQLEQGTELDQLYRETIVAEQKRRRK